MNLIVGGASRCLSWSGGGTCLDKSINVDLCLILTPGLGCYLPLRHCRTFHGRLLHRRTRCTGSAEAISVLRSCNPQPYSATAEQIGPEVRGRLTVTV